MGDCTRLFEAHADAVLWGLEVIADDRDTLAPELIDQIVAASLACDEKRIDEVARVIDLAGRVRWREHADARTLLAARDASRPSPSWMPALERLRHAMRR